MRMKAEFNELGQLRIGPLFPVMIEFPVLGRTDSEGRTDFAILNILQ
jgi:hypothetical protein